MKKFVDTITESSLFILLFLIIFAASISVISLSPISRPITQGSIGEDKVAGAISTSEVFKPFLASGEASFSNQLLTKDRYTTDILLQKVLIGENKVGILEINNTENFKYFEVTVTFDENYDQFKSFVEINGARTLLSKYMTDGSTSFRFEATAGETKDINLIIESEERINFPVRINFSVDGKNL